MTELASIELQRLTCANLPEREQRAPKPGNDKDVRAFYLLARTLSDGK